MFICLQRIREGEDEQKRDGLHTELELGRERGRRRASVQGDRQHTELELRRET